MNSKKIIKCFSEEKSQELEKHGFKKLYSQNGVFYFEFNEKLSVKFSDNELFKDTKVTTTVNF